MSDPTLKELLKPPFIIYCDGTLRNGDNRPLASVISWSDEGNEFNEYELFIWITTAMNEKLERVYGKRKWRIDEKRNNA